MTEPRTKPGRHRAPSRWARHQAAHGDPEQGLLTQLMPSWKYNVERRGRRRAGDAAHREDVVADDRSGPAWSGGLAEQEALGLAHEPAESTNPASVDLVALETSPEAPLPPFDPDSESLMGHTEFLPDEENGAASSLASLFGFGEPRARYVPAGEEQIASDSAWDSLPTLADVALLDGQDTGTGTSVQRLWEATEDHSIAVSPLDETIEGPPLRLLDSRRFRRTAIVGLIGALLVVAWGIRQVGGQPERAAVAREVQYGESGLDIRNAVSPISDLVALVANPDLPASGFSDLTARLDVLDGAARSGAAVAAESLPRSIPGGSSLALDALVLPQSLLEQSSRQALTLERRIGDAVTYRLIFANAFDLPPLPTEADLLEIGTIGADLSVAIAQTEQVLAELPDDTFFGAHRQQAFDRLAMITAIQSDYFEALRAGDEQTATTVRDQILAAGAASHAELSDPLNTTVTWSGEQLVELNGVLDELDRLTSG